MPNVVATKIVPCAPIVLWAANTTQQFSSRHDWSAGRSLQPEETRCGMLCTLHSLHTPSSESPSSTAKHKLPSKAIIPRPFTPHPCVIKAQSTDVLLNEIQANGDITTIHQTAPKGRWKKTDKGSSLLVEDDSSQLFSDPSKEFTPRMMNQGRYARRMGKVPAATPLLPFTLYRDGHAMEAVQHRLYYETGIQELAVGFGQCPSGFGCITQSGVSVGVSKELLPHASRHYNIRPLLFYPNASMKSIEELPQLTLPPRGNLCRILLRCVKGTPDEIQTSIQSIQDNGFVNYFDLGRFGIAGAHGFETAAAAYTRQDFVKATGMFLQTLAEHNAMHYEMFMRYVNVTDGLTARHMAGAWLERARQYNTSRHELRVLKALSDADMTSTASAHESMKHVWSKIQHVWAQPMIHGAAEFVWNAMASARLLNYGKRVVPGDLVRVSLTGSTKHNPTSATSGALLDSFLNHSDPSLDVEVRLVKSEAEAAEFSLEDVVLPIPYATGRSNLSAVQYPSLVGVCDGASYRRFADAHSLSFLFEKEEGDEGSSALPRDSGALASRRTFDMYRSLIAKPQHMDSKVLYDPNSFTALKSDLFLAQERAPLLADVTSIHDRRVRTPCVYNVSERFVDRMKPVLESRKGTGASSSVVLSCMLPRGSHYTVMLRERFNAAQAQFHDLLDLSW